MITATGSATSRRAAKPIASVEARSSHCASSTVSRRGVGRDQTEHGGADDQPVGLGARPEAERRAQRVGVEGRQAVEAIERGLKQLAETSEWNVGFELNAAGREHPHRSGLLDRVLEQRSLSDSGLAADDQTCAVPQPRSGQGLVDRKELPLSS